MGFRVRGKDERGPAFRVRRKDETGWLPAFAERTRGALHFSVRRKDETGVGSSIRGRDEGLIDKDRYHHHGLTRRLGAPLAET